MARKGDPCPRTFSRKEDRAAFVDYFTQEMMRDGARTVEVSHLTHGCFRVSVTVQCGDFKTAEGAPLWAKIAFDVVGGTGAHNILGTWNAPAPLCFGREMEIAGPINQFHFGKATRILRPDAVTATLGMDVRMIRRGEAFSAERMVARGTVADWLPDVRS